MEIDDNAFGTSLPADNANLSEVKANPIRDYFDQRYEGISNLIEEETSRGTRYRPDF
jgi:hypothetical protein